MIIPRILVFAGSLRVGAFSGQVADVAQKELALQGAEVTRISLGDYPLPLMDQNLEREKGIPGEAMQLARQILAHDGILIASPEYNASIPPLLKNAIDWVSRVRRDGDRAVKPFGEQAAALCSSSDGAFAGMRGLYHLRAVLMACGAEVVTPQCSVPHASKAFDSNGDLVEERLRKQMETVCRALVQRAAQLSKRADA
ncbi:NADPH-dependent FMN reductase [Tianweitania sediminis]|uniref:NAD(P)H-dependent oxidoreductase n=1 Tax=Tianweitania sediminis TaxID=1502156 RepID=A0A8J7R068_9HYPH|nr:NAD(P)H-dependent oxidoreductase [Tianweitania sediminis]MBP0437491.1 NAD(P)H-dependent oxidoreductase [Tianweitania sediminis]